MARNALPAETKAALDDLAEATRNLNDAVANGTLRGSDVVKRYSEAMRKAESAGATDEEIESTKLSVVS